MAKKTLSIIIGILIVVGTIVTITSSTNDNDENKIETVIYKSPTCGCCVKYIPYLERKDFGIETISTEDMDSIKNEHGIPKHMESCHTMIVEDYFVEGHVSEEAINKLLEERPDIDGISLPGMPSGSPGMPGKKQEDWTIYAIKEGKISEFMII